MCVALDVAMVGEQEVRYQLECRCLCESGDDYVPNTLKRPIN